MSGHPFESFRFNLSQADQSITQSAAYFSNSYGFAATTGMDDERPSSSCSPAFSCPTDLSPTPSSRRSINTTGEPSTPQFAFSTKQTLNVDISTIAYPSFRSATPSLLNGDISSCSPSSFQTQLMYTPMYSPMYENPRQFDTFAPRNLAYSGIGNDYGPLVGTECISSPPINWHPPESVDHTIYYNTSYGTTHHGDDGDESAGDEPYARLIYKALMQAPGHRMMLRDIYEWFQRHTTKPRESGTNGWQNSIRHNLSMNQAFENDKTESSSRVGHARKSNSVWVLAESAIKNGVQSTTRYRKTGSAKKTGLNRMPAIQRQRSGAKGGQAARRAAKLRRREQSEFRKQLSPLSATPSLSTHGFGDSYTTNTEIDCLSRYTPETPPDERLFAMPVGIPMATYSSSMAVTKWEDQCSDETESDIHGLGFASGSDPCLAEMLRCHQDPKSPLIPV